MSNLRIKDWHKFQHFKDRRPPWIKLYRDILDDIEWHDLDGDTAKALTMLWLIASENDGALPSLREIAFRLRVSEKQAKSTVSKLSHWLEQDDITPISGRYQDDPLETETEEEREEEREVRVPAPPASRTRKGNGRGSRLEEHWKPSDQDRGFAEGEGLGAELIEREAGRFRDYWLAQPGQRGVKLDWAATWRNWVRRSKEFKRNGSADRTEESDRSAILAGLGLGNGRASPGHG